MESRASPPGLLAAKGRSRRPSLHRMTCCDESAGNKPKVIEEYVGRINNATVGISVAHMHSPEGWEEPGQTPEFDEYTVVLRGTLRVQHKSGEVDVTAGQAVIAHRGEWVRYSTPFSGGAEYIALCLPAFSPDTVHRDR